MKDLLSRSDISTSSTTLKYQRQDFKQREEYLIAVKKQLGMTLTYKKW